MHFLSGLFPNRPVRLGSHTTARYVHQVTAPVCCWYIFVGCWLHHPTTCKFVPCRYKLYIQNGQEYLSLCLQNTCSWIRLLDVLITQVQWIILLGVGCSFGETYIQFIMARRVYYIWSGVAIDTSGSRKWTAQYFMPHGITADHQGTIWLTDVAMHQVFKIPPGQTVPKMTLGQKFQHGEDTNLFCKPSDVSVLLSGEFFVSDGYCYSRVLKFSKDGTFLMSFGKRNVQFGAVPPVVTFDIPHSITVSEEHHLVCVADRENNRIQCFDLDGNFKQVIKCPEFGPRLFALEYCPAHGGLLYAVNGPAFEICWKCGMYQM
ncbi:peptidyl-glycine alpha-amidating monooxygenase A-like isoform X4 [Biomphalaria glabrata]|nr:peptidyl-glycine alpha-amidating monooxygenase A-like isoform X4 [Biomphalaria glabrata]